TEMFRAAVGRPKPSNGESAGSDGGRAARGAEALPYASAENGDGAVGCESICATGRGAPAVDGAVGCESILATGEGAAVTGRAGSADGATGCACCGACGAGAVGAACGGRPT